MKCPLCKIVDIIYSSKLPTRESVVSSIGDGSRTTEEETTSVMEPLVCHICWPKQTNWNDPCKHAKQVWQAGYKSGKLEAERFSSSEKNRLINSHSATLLALLDHSSNSDLTDKERIDRIKATITNHLSQTRSTTI